MGTSQSGPTQTTAPADGSNEPAVQYYLGFAPTEPVVGAKAFWGDESALPRSALADLAGGAKQGPDGPIVFFDGDAAVAWQAVGGNRVWGLRGGNDSRVVVSGDEAALLAGGSPDISVAIPATYSNKYFGPSSGKVAIAADANDGWVVLETPEAINGADSLLTPKTPVERLWKIDATDGSKLGEVLIDDPSVKEYVELFDVAVGADAVFVTTSHGVFAVDKKTLKVTHTVATADYAPDDSWSPSRIFVAGDKVVVQHSVSGPFDETKPIGIAVLDAATLKVDTVATIEVPDGSGLSASYRSEYIDGHLYLPGQGLFEADLTGDGGTITPKAVVTMDDLAAAHRTAVERINGTAPDAATMLQGVKSDGKELVASGENLVTIDLTKLP